MRAWQAVGLSVLMLGLAQSHAVAAPLTTNTALPVGKGEFIIRGQLVLRERDSASDAQIDAAALVSVLGYGLTPDLALFGVLPYIDKSMTPSTGPRRRTEGVGDATLFGRYTLWRDDVLGRTARIAAIGGVIAPTGKEDDRDALGTLPRPFQNGAGAWGGHAGVVATWQTLKFQVDGQFLYQRFGSDQGYRRGDVRRFDLSLQYRLWPQALSTLTTGFLYALLESNLIDVTRDDLSGMRTDTGGTQWFLTPGLQYITQRWIVEGGAQLPVKQNPHGNAFTDDYIARFGLRFNF